IADQDSNVEKMASVAAAARAAETTDKPMMPDATAPDSAAAVMPSAPTPQSDAIVPAATEQVVVGKSAPPEADS
ncbi:hypothetical protein ACI3PF_21070, partial [Lactococcus lactis]